MEDEVKVTEVPVVETPETPADEPIIETKRQQIEKLVEAENNKFEPEIPKAPEVAEKKEEKVEDSDDPIARIKQSVQKRIDKVVAKQKSAEEKLAEAEAELERLRAERANPKTPEAVVSPKDDTPPTPEQVEAYIAKMQEEGNHKEAAAAIRYLVKLEKEIALKEVTETQTKAQREQEAKRQRELKDWTALQNDYIVYGDDQKPDLKHDLSLANQNGLLYKTALSLYNDKELHAEHYNDPDVIRGFRNAVADAYREIHQQGLIKQTPKGETAIPRNRRMALAEPDADAVEETVQTNTNSSLSDADKVRAEILARKKNRFIRPLPQ